MTAAGHPLRRLGETAIAVLESLNQHRLLSTAQVHELHAPRASRRWAQEQLALLREVGLAESASLPGRRLLWHLTERGVDAAETIPSRAETRRKVISPEQAAGPLQQRRPWVSLADRARRRAHDRGDRGRGRAGGLYRPP